MLESNGIMKQSGYVGAIADTLGILSFIAMMALGAWVFIPLPFTPVPITLQTLFVLMSGLMLGKHGKTSMLGYLLLGAFGYGLFAQGSHGLGLLAGPTGGYLIGFVVASAFLGAVRTHLDSFPKTLFAVGFASFGILALGTLQLGVLFHLSATSALLMGFLPFVPGEISKVLFVSGLYRFAVPRQR